MSTSTSSVTVATGFFTVLALLIFIYTLGQWWSAIMLWGDSWAFAQALTWTIFTLLAFIPVIGLEKFQARGE